MNKMQIKNLKIPTCAIKQFGNLGVLYIVGDINSMLPNGDAWINITLLETGQKDLYLLS